MRRDRDHFAGRGTRGRPFCVAAAAAFFGVALLAPAAALSQPLADQAKQAEGEMSAGLRALAYAALNNGTAINTARAETLCRDAASRSEGNGAAKADACLSAAAQSVSPDWRYERLAPRGAQAASVGIGVVFKAVPGGLAITDVVPGSPAEAAGLARGETIVAIGDAPTAGSPADVAARLIRGAAGTAVRITLGCAGCSAQRQVTLVRKPFRQEPFYASSMRDAWYVQVRGYGGTVSDTRGIAPQLRQLRGELPERAAPRMTVIDLRGNTGGLAQSIVDTSAVFLPAGMPVMYSVSASGAEPMAASPDGSQADEAKPRGPLIVLVDHDTGNGSEWLAESLQRYGGALVVGEPTSGQVQVRRGIEPFEGARITFPAGEILGSGGSVLQGHGVQPDVVLDKPRLADMPLGQPPAWLQAWLEVEMPAAIRARDERPARRPLPWRGASSSAARARTLCLGSAAAPIGAEFPETSRRRSELRIEAASFSGAITSMESDELPFDAAAAQVESDQARLRSLIDMAIADERKASAARAAGARRQSGSTRELRDWRMRLPLVISAPVGDTGARVYRYENGYSEALWRAAGTNHSIRLDLVADESNAKVVAAYAEALARLQARPDDAAPPATAGVCIANAFLGLTGPIDEIEWQGGWQLPGEGAAMVEWRGHFSASGGPAAVAGRQETEAWMLAPVRDCASAQAPLLSNEPMGGLMGVTRRSARTGEGSCRVLRSVSRLSRADAPGFDYAAGVALSGLAAEPLRQAEAAWRAALERIAVLDTPAAPPGHRPSRSTAPAVAPTVSAPALPPPPAKRSR